MYRKAAIFSFFGALVPALAFAAMGHRMDMTAMVMNANAEQLPADCDAISEDVEIMVHAGTRHAMYRNGKLFGYDDHEWNVQPCARVTVTFLCCGQMSSCP